MQALFYTYNKHCYVAIQIIAAMKTAKNAVQNELLIVLLCCGKPEKRRHAITKNIALNMVVVV